MHILVMGGYGRFVWSAYGVSAIALIAAVVLTLRQYFGAVRQLHRMQTENKKSSA
jgi:heme exporter protein CcmD